MTLSLCMIVKNEEATLARCLASVRGVCDELVVVDTGSTDSTPRIARDFGARCLEFPWQDDFSAARNFALDHTSGPWVLQLDADETLYRDDHEKLREVIATATDQVAAFNVLILNDLPSGGVGSLVFPRLFRGGIGIRYEGIVHNQLIVPGPIGDSDIRVHHTGYADATASAKRYARSGPLLRRQIEQDPEDPFPRYNLAILCHERGMFDEATEHACEAVRLLEAGSRAVRGLSLDSAQDLLGLCYVARDQWDDASRMFEQALDTCPDAPDALFDLALTRQNQGRLDDAVALYKRYLDARADWCRRGTRMAEQAAMLRSLHSAHIAWNNLGCTHRALGQIDAARAAFHRSLEEKPDLAAAHGNLGNLEACAGDFARAELHYRSALSLGPENPDLLEKLGVSLAHLERHVEARVAFERVTQLMPGSAQAWSNLGLCDLVLGNLDAAAQDLNHALAMDPQHPEALRNVGFLKNVCARSR